MNRSNSDMSVGKSGSNLVPHLNKNLSGMRIGKTKNSKWSVLSYNLTHPAKIRCPNPWPAFLKSSYAYKAGISSQLPHTQDAYRYVVLWLDGLAWDVIYRLGMIFDSGNYNDIQNRPSNETRKWSMMHTYFINPNITMMRVLNYTMLSGPPVTIVSMTVSNPDEVSWTCE
ncbi:uncharacterized protein I206_107289 [Kwoniella pini CBS 10737]|uniref:Uncharacterized protein n=1 Tax=Kwoniella pini CBS 10737 TaxID=1296096 RepID=A0A1B9HYQ6_9TREE|nr:uncharacterized protein I206_05167 [Kwoniella pini CBS 10737]OCF48390.1 hypothetical protein I206_05167 [Kwoniella pini CBS 10737]